MSKYNRKQKTDLKEDQFVDFWSRMFMRIDPYLRAIGITIGTAFVIWFAAFGVLNHFEHRAEAATELFGRAVRIYEADLITDDKTPKPPGAEDEEAAVPRYRTDKERADAAVAELATLDKTSGAKEIGKRAQLLRASVLYDQGKFAEAAPLFEAFAKESQHPALAAIALESLGLCQEAMGKQDEALATYKSLEPKTGDFYRDRALYAQARVLLKKGDKSGAIAAWKQLLDKMPTSPLKDDTVARMQILEDPPAAKPSTP